MTDLEIAKKLLHHYHSAKDRNIEFSLTFKDIRRLYGAKCCYFTRVPFTDSGHNSRSVDRVDNDVGYTSSNTVACNKRLNGIKNNLSAKEIVALYKGLRRKKIVQ